MGIIVHFRNLREENSSETSAQWINWSINVVLKLLSSNPIAQNKNKPVELEFLPCKDLAEITKQLEIILKMQFSETSPDNIYPCTLLLSLYCRRTMRKWPVLNRLVYALSMLCRAIWEKYWASPHHFLQDCMRAKRRLRSDCASAQSDQSLHMALCVYSQGSKATSSAQRRLLSLRRCASRAKSSLGAPAIV